MQSVSAERGERGRRNGWVVGRAYLCVGVEVQHHAARVWAAIQAVAQMRFGLVGQPQPPVLHQNAVAVEEA